MDVLFSSEAISALLTLTFLEIILGIDNIIFITIAVGKLPQHLVKKATNIGLALAMILRLVLLFGISYLIAMQSPWLVFETSWIQASISGQAVILFLGGLFLIYKSTKEINEKTEHTGEHESQLSKQRKKSLSQAILQITVINIVFSFDSILTAVGMTNGIPNAFIIMAIAIVLSVIIMMLFAKPVGNFVNEHPSLQILGLSFLILIGFMLLAEAAHLSNAVVFGQHIGAIPKGYLYFAISFSLFVEFLNMRRKKNA